jgi:hypothetical protein
VDRFRVHWHAVESLELAAHRTSRGWAEKSEREGGAIGGHRESSECLPDPVLGLLTMDRSRQWQAKD